MLGLKVVFPDSDTGTSGGEFQPDMYQFYTHRVIQSRVCKNLHYVNINLAKQNTLTHIYLSYRIRATLKVSSKT